MTSSPHRRFLALVVFALVVVGTACGNYSNEDLEFMNALPKQADLSVEIPARSSAITILEEAELARKTHETTRDFNGLTATLVGLVDLIRSYPPTSRTRDSRVWGPFGPGPRDTTNLDWQRRMLVRRDMLDPNVFDFEIAVHKVGTSDLAWPVFVRGSFDAGKTARQGMGHIEVALAAVRAAGFDASDWKALDHLEIDYKKPYPATATDPIHISMMITDLPDDSMTPMNPAPTVTYDYQATDDGQGQMAFDVFANIIGLPTSPIEHVNITSLWLPRGEGRSDLSVVSGDGVGLRQTECWDRSFKATFNVKPFASGENVGADASVCPMITMLSAPAF
ncbi:MAG: hypothetical protein JWM82_950 [Myxococcales bacterium]|nr:hypothetical protein [Myxococcales bacterium]